MTLTPRELECLTLVADGLTDEQVAGRLGIAPRTARFHMQHTMVKLDARNRTHAVALAIRTGLLPERTAA